MRSLNNVTDATNIFLANNERIMDVAPTSAAGTQWLHGIWLGCCIGLA
jgi:hypothetical protein